MEPEYKVGTKVVVLKTVGKVVEMDNTKVVLNDPHPEHIGKKGIIIGFHPELSSSPEIQLEDGTILFGYECWWDFDEEK